MKSKNTPTWKLVVAVAAFLTLSELSVSVRGLRCEEKNNICHGKWSELEEFTRRIKRTVKTFIVRDCNTVDAVGGTTRLNGTGMESLFISTPCSSLTINVESPKSNASVAPLPCVALEVNDYKIFSLEGNFYFNNIECVNSSSGSETTPQDSDSELLLTDTDFISLKLPGAGTIFYAYFKKTDAQISRHFKLNPNGNYSRIVAQGIRHVADAIGAPRDTEIVTRRTTVAYSYLEEEKRREENRRTRRRSSHVGPFFFLGIFLVTLSICTSCVVLTRPCHDKKYRDDYISCENLDKEE